MNENDLHIDESTHETVPNTAKRLKNALLAVLMGFLLVQIIGFWMFPGIGLGGLYMFSSAHSIVGFVGEIANIVIIAFLAICGVVGWFNGRYFTDRLKNYISYWKFW